MATVSAERSALIAEHPGRRAASPWEPDSSRALIYTAANPDELLRREGARRSPWHFPLCVTPILEIHLYLSFQVESSVFLACEHQLMNPGWGFLLVSQLVTQAAIARSSAVIVSLLQTSCQSRGGLRIE